MSKIRQLVTSCIDVSDGFIADLEKILIPSKQGAVIHLDEIPRADKLSLEDYTFGDDLELIFTADKKHHKKIIKLSDNSGININLIGHTRKNSEIKYKYRNRNIKRDFNTFELKNIYFSYNQNNKPKNVIENINLKISKGDFIGIFGKTGSGKSTLLDVIMGLLKPKITGKADAGIASGLVKKLLS